MKTKAERVPFGALKQGDHLNLKVISYKDIKMLLREWDEWTNKLITKRVVVSLHIIKQPISIKTMSLEGSSICAWESVAHAQKEYKV